MAPLPLLDIAKSKPLTAFTEAVGKEPLLIEGLWDSPKALLLVLAQEKLGRPLLVITSEGSENRVVDDLLFLTKRKIEEFPAWETLPGEEIAPSPDLIGRRMAILHRLMAKERLPIVLTSLQGILQKLPPPGELEPLCHLWKVGQKIAFEEVTPILEKLGFKRSVVAADKGEYAVRGGIVDLFPVSATDPYRLDFFGDEIEAIRIYDPVSQKSIGKAEEIFISPADELSLIRKSPSLATLLDYFKEPPLLVFDDLLALEDRYAAIRGLPGATGRYFLSIGELLACAKELPKLFWTKESIEELSADLKQKKSGRAFYSGEQICFPCSFTMFDEPLSATRLRHAFVEIRDYFSPHENQTALGKEEIFLGLSRADPKLRLQIVSTTESEERSFLSFTEEHKITLPKQTEYDRGYLSSGFVELESNFALLPQTELTRRYQVRREKMRSTYHLPAAEFHELEIGDLVVHFHSGIGKYVGLEKIKSHLGEEEEFLVIAYAKGSRLFTPVSQSHLISRYIGAKEESPVLHTLGTKKWQQTKTHAEKAIVGYAKELLELSAKREIKGGYVYPPDSDMVRAFEEEFPFVETEDQKKAIADLKADMIGGKAMDRLICGDVGYGKTEVAMRTAFKAVIDGGKQVALLVPTTILAMQHYESFCARMANYPIKIGVLSRFRKPKEIKETLQLAKEGKIDILIGTHRLISQDVLLPNLGLVIIDEEQRFGVRAKEHLKKLKVTADSLTLSATPIPRTLYLSLVGARDISTIQTPPQDRLPIKTIIAEKTPDLLKNALLRELSRGGQAYVIHNRVESIDKVADEISALLPQANVIAAHGQMDADEIDTLFHLFKTGEADILVATTIVENGIDIPNANTILIDKADQYGMADLYQLRGRVGRWNRPAFAYFLTTPNRSLAEPAQKRLAALAEIGGYGGGMKIAMRDLEIRGAGDILGVQQSGHISTIGFHLYCKLLKKTVDAMHHNIAPNFTETKIEGSFPASLPHSYISDTSLRLEIYHRFGSLSSPKEAEELLAEVQDRFGPPPLPVVWLYHLTRIRLLAASLRITLLRFDKLTFTAEFPSGKKLFTLKSANNPAALEEYLTKTLCAK